MGKPQKYRLGELLVQQGLVTEAQLEEALAQQKQSGRKLGRVLVESGVVTEELIATAIARQLGIEFHDLREKDVEPAVASVLPETMARRFRALVLADEGRSYLVGMADPSDVFGYDEIARTLKKDVSLAVLAEGQLLGAIDRLYRRTHEITGLANELQRDLGNAYVDFGGPALETTADDAPVVKLLQSIFEDAFQIKASDVHIEPQELRLQIRFRIDGEMHLQTEVDSRVGPALVLRLKLMSGLDISEKRLPQDGRFNVKVKQQSVDVRLSTMPTQYGESVVMRILAQNSGLLDLDRIGMPAEMLAHYRRMINHSYGMILVTGPTGSGKTTTLYATLAALNAPSTKIITIEDPVEYRLPGLSQVQVNDKIELSFARVLRSTLRHDPDIVLVGEMIDQETAQIGVRAAMTGHLLLSTLHTNDAVSTPARLLDMGVPQYLLATTLLGVIAQRLVRMICPACKTPASLDANEQIWLEREAKGAAAQAWHGRGCSQCNNSGFAGREAIYEMLEMTPPLAEALSRNSLADFSRLARSQLAGKTMRAHAVARVLAGETTVAEAMRVSTQIDE
ncbi:GspE/PulE family protein [Uliginosibacterium sp. TH139]|uniref:GspE/PulE family protein n=1 Tax=Uliginosibacterium sp. TH139 TaxID=2067453 RepID=UPI000C7C2B9F|nr:GspE/PulE family protein [Uliginosibacterium sp. TH139]PLK48586.1 MSHA biogenesis protein MshE [Uliginosibacterium sp. TH139]